MPEPEDRELTIVNTASGKALQPTSPDAGSEIGQCWRTGDSPQRWRLRPVLASSSVHLVEHVETGLVLAPHAGSREAGVRVGLTSERDAPHARWRLIPASGGEHVLRNVHSGKVLDLWDAGFADDTPIAQAEHWHGPQQRWKLTPDGAGGQTRAVFTLARNENVFLPIWLRYYGQFFAPEDIHVLDHRSTDGSTRGEGFVRVPVDGDAFSAGWQHDTVQQYQHELTDRYDVVVYSDADEIVAPDPRYCDLGAYLDAFDEEFATCTGYEVLHMRGAEPPFDSARGVLAQRSFWFANPLHSKSLIARTPMLWEGGFHQRADGWCKPDPNLYLVHLHRMDYDLCLARNEERSRFPWADLDRANGWGYQNYITDPDQFARWFYHDSCGAGPVEPEPIPPHWQELV